MVKFLKVTLVSGTVKYLSTKDIVEVRPIDESSCEILMLYISGQVDRFKVNQNAEAIAEMLNSHVTKWGKVRKATSAKKEKS